MVSKLRCDWGYQFLEKVASLVLVPFQIHLWWSSHQDRAGTRSAGTDHDRSCSRACSTSIWMRYLIRKAEPKKIIERSDISALSIRNYWRLRKCWNKEFTNSAMLQLEDIHVKVKECFHIISSNLYSFFKLRNFWMNGEMWVSSNQIRAIPEHDGHLANEHLVVSLLRHVVFPSDRLCDICIEGRRVGQIAQTSL